MNKSMRAALIAAAFFSSAAGCELIASVDRSTIGQGGGGKGGSESVSSSSSSSSSGVAGNGGTAGAGGNGGTAGAGGTGGSGGTGGIGGAAGSGGTGGGTTCVTAADCPATGNPCVDATCINAACGTAPTSAGTNIATQTVGDCQVDQCDGAGNVKAVVDDTDLPDDKNDCTSNVCTNGTPTNPPLVIGAMCGANMTLFCDGQGACVGCNAPADCGTDTTCKTRTCTAGVCGASFAPAGTFDVDPTPGDCTANQCDGAGNSVAGPYATDLPVDNNACTNDVCTAGTASNPPVNAGATCSQNGGTVCNGTGACVQCISASTCPGQDTECQVRSCTLGACGFSNTPVGTPTAMQTAGDCKKNQCDGNGSIAVAIDNGDLPVDGNSCTGDVCTGGVPTNPPVASGTMCGSNGLCNAVGQCVGCIVASDCPGMDTECQARSCNAGVCGFSYTSAGTSTATQTAGDCKVNQCNGTGAIVTVTNNADLPVDGNQCTSDVCTAGVPSNPPTGSGTTCSQNGGVVCSGAGACVQCVVASTCPGIDNECQTRTCNANTCGFSYVLAGTATAMQTAGDCKVNQCNGAGAIVAATNNADLPNDGNQCTSDVCTAGIPSNPPTASGAACNQNGGAVCSGAGACVQCVVAATCAGTDTECQTRTCNANTCGFSFTAAGTPVASQSPGDCKQNQCNGAGSTVTVNDNADLPIDGNTCTSDICTSGTPSNPPVASGTICGSNGLCNMVGQCVGCLVATDCPGVDTECQARTCNAGSCGFSFTTAGTPVAMQTAGDCQVNQCNGSGSIVAVANNADLPVDGNQCTNDICTAGFPSNPPTGSGTTCNQNGGAVCSGAGACVQCVVASTCAGTDTECQTRTCNSNTCGFSFTPAGTPVASQSTGDCKKNQCNGTGSTVTVNDNTDLPIDMNQCTDDVCTAGVPSNPPSAVNTSCNQGGGVYCDGASSCVQCNAATQCAGTDTECQTRTCSLGTCGFSYTAAGTPVASQSTGDCKSNQCDGSGATVSVNDNADVPVDGFQCTNDVCSNGVPSNPPLPLNANCSQSGGMYCDGATSCVQCTVAAQCPGSDNACQTRTCTAGACGFSYMPAGTVIASQTSGDCKVNQCDGAGSTVTVNDNADLPIDTNQCTDDLCINGVPSNPASAPNTSCSQNGGLYCDGATFCVQCNIATQCTGTDTECQTRTCSAGSCGFSYTANGTPVSSQTPGDCKSNQCNGSGLTVTVNDNADLPVDPNQCTNDVCTNGVPSNPPFPVGTTCNQSGGTACDNTVTCALPPTVTATSPANLATPIAGNTLSVTFSRAMNPATLSVTSTAGACTGSVQVSLNDFASCIAITGASLVGNVYTMTAAPGLLVNRTYKIRVTTAATATNGLPLAATFTLANGFTTTSPNICEGSLVISQVYGGGGNTGAQYTNDFVELHNRGTSSISLAGMSLQYAGATGTVWNAGGSGIALLSGTIPAGGYFLVQLGAGAGTGVALPAPVFVPVVALGLSASAGKIALINATTQIPDGACPPLATTIDFVAYGATATATCTTGFGVTAAPSNTTAVLRLPSGCGDSNSGLDFAVLAPAPRNAATAPLSCTCNDMNESNVALEADYCNVQSPTSISIAAGSLQTVYGQVYELGTTPAPGAPVNVRAQLGYGPTTANPEYEAGWTWSGTTYNVQAVNNDEYTSTFTVPVSGSYRYVYRFSLDQGVNWTVCDRGIDTGAGSDPNLSFEFADMPIMTVP